MGVTLHGEDSIFRECDVLDETDEGEGITLFGDGAVNVDSSVPDREAI